MTPAAQGDRFLWWLPVLAAILTLIVSLLLPLFLFDIGEILYILLIAPLVVIILLIAAVVFAVRKKPRTSLSFVSMLIIYCVITWGLFIKSSDLRMTERWLLHRSQYQAQVLAQPNPANGELKHIDWDGWGFAGMDTEVDLVFDPDDRLAAAASSHAAGKYPGLPCKVPGVRRLEKNWYAITFYTGTVWDFCG